MSATLDTIPGAQRQLSAAGPAARRFTRRLASDRAGEPGFIQRFENFEELRDKAQRWRGTTTPKGYIADIITWLPGLTGTEKDLMRVQLSFISPEELLTGAGGVTEPLPEYTAMRMRKTVATVKRVRRTAEAKGLLLRHVDGDNNSAKTDIRPFLADIDRYREAYEADFAARRERFDKAKQFTSLDDEMIPWGSTDAIHIQSPKTTCNPVPPSVDGDEDSAAKAAERSIREAESGLSPDESPRRRQCSAPRSAGRGVDARNCSPGGAGSSFRASRPRVDQAQTAQTGLTEAFRHSVSLSSYVQQPDIDRLDLPALYAACERAVVELLPGRNTLHTWQWAVKNHSWGAIVRLIVALDDPAVRDRYAVLGALAKPDGTGVVVHDGFRSNFARMARRREEIELAAEAEADAIEPTRPSPAGTELGAAEAPTAAEQWPAFLDALKAQLGAAAFVNMLRGLALIEYSEGDWLKLTVSSAAAVTWANGRRHEFKKAAATIGWRFAMFNIRAIP